MNKLTKINYNEIKSSKISENNTSFVIQPLERGMANTLGTALRRVLLSSVHGLSMFAIKVSGIDHEYITIKNVSVDVLTLISNLSFLKFKYNEQDFNNDSIYKIHFKSSKTGPITFKDLELPAGLEFANGLNLDTKIAEIVEADALEFELFIKAGRGYVGFERNKLLIEQRKNELHSNIKSGKILAVDSNFSPIVKVMHKSEELNSASYEIQERLQLDIETNGSVEAKTAISFAAKILMAHLQTIGNVENLDLNDIFETKEKEKEVSKYDNMTIDDLDLTVRSSNGLKRAHITKISELVKLSETEFKNIPSIGEKSVKEIIEKLKEKKIELNKGDE